MSIRHSYFQLPVEMARYAYHHKRQKGLALYLFLKFHCDGIIHDNNAAFIEARLLPCMQDERTFNKYIRELIGLNWIGYNIKSGFYFIRGFDEIRVAHGFRGRQAATIELKDTLHMQAFLVAVIIGSRVNAQVYYWERGGGRRLAAMNKKGVAFQPNSFPADFRPNYYGLSNAAIARELGCKTTRACELKQEAGQLGYLRAKQHFEVIKTMTKPDPRIRTILYEQHPEWKGKLVFRKCRRNRQAFIQVLLQQYCEIIPLVHFKTIVKFSHILVPGRKEFSALTDIPLQAATIKVA